ncbi:two-component sensor histidine kinase [Nocardia colli]|uniref:histidine kinase n=2 Tax=Nocardia colli TaxID=2545717 RepID=A0A5N0DYZ9_9NOCA|nr:two-component sensor histidine kinase [Nocardia colli]
MVLVLSASFVAALNGSMLSGGDYINVYSAAVVLCGIALIMEPRYPTPAPILSTLAAGVLGWPMLPPLLLALFFLAARGRLWASVGCVTLALAGNSLSHPEISLRDPQPYGPIIFLMLAVVLGLWVGSRRRLVDALAARVEYLHSERALREQAARLAERAAIATEMHDVLAHRLSLIALHTGVLSKHREPVPDVVSERISLLRTAATDALADLRDVLGALRDSDDSVPGAPPVPVLREVDELIEQARAAGQQIELTSEGHPTDAPTAHRLAVVRVVQEALTNTRKHAPDAAVRVLVSYGPPATLVEISNTAAAQVSNSVTSGFGLIGLSERIEALGGHLDAGPSGAGAWAVVARIPHPGTEDRRRTEPEGATP